jgi:transcription termination factor Rho
VYAAAVKPATVRRALVQRKIAESTETMIARLSKTKTNVEFLKLIVR